MTSSVGHDQVVNNNSGELFTLRFLKLVLHIWIGYKVNIVGIFSDFGNQMAIMDLDVSFDVEEHEELFKLLYELARDFLLSLHNLFGDFVLLLG